MWPLIYPTTQIFIKCSVAIRYCGIDIFGDLGGVCKNDHKFPSYVHILAVRYHTSHQKVKSMSPALVSELVLWLVGKKCDASNGFHSRVRVSPPAGFGALTPPCGCTWARLQEKKPGDTPSSLANRQTNQQGLPASGHHLSHQRPLDMRRGQKRSAELPRPESPDHRITNYTYGGFKPLNWGWGSFISKS